MPHARPDALPELSASQRQTIEANRCSSAGIAQRLAEEDEYEKWRKSWIEDEARRGGSDAVPSGHVALAQRVQAGAHQAGRVAIEGGDSKHVLSGFDNKAGPSSTFGQAARTNQAEPASD
ncbi:hypothetical protein L7F22_053199 [Adiantum nelumboides]|nr:hypothetical protein [Adiantum nelumboides]